MASTISGTAAASMTADLLAKAAVDPPRLEGMAGGLELPVGNRWACAETIGRTFAALSGSPRTANLGVLGPQRA